MAIKDRALQALRRVFGDERDAREVAESPSADALRHAPSSTYAIWGREDIGGLLSVSQNLMDRYADYEAMNDYPDIRCFTGDMKVYIVDETGVITPKTIKEVAQSTETYRILGYDTKKKVLVPVDAEHPRISGRNAPVLALKLSNGETLRVTPDHKIFCAEPVPGYVEAKLLKKGAFIVGARGGFETSSKSMLTVRQAGGVWLAEDPVPDCFEPEVYDISTSTRNLLVNGVVCHNSAFHYFANDATQPNMDNGRVCWVQSPDQAVVDMSDTLIKRRLRLEDDLFSIAYTLAQYGNCLPGSAKVWLEDSIEPISNVTVGDRVVLYADGEATTAPVSAVINNGVKTTYRLKTKHREIVATAEHPFLVDDAGGPNWKTLAQLKRGDPIYVCTQSPPNGDPFPLAELVPTANDLTLPKTITPEFCRLYGYAIADGQITDHELNKSVGICCGNKPDHAAYYLEVAQSFAPRSYLSEQEGTFKLHIGSASMVELFKKLGWKNGASVKRAPGWLWGLPEDHREAFLQGVADGDGHTTKTPTDNHSRISIELCNRELVEDIKSLVDGLGYKCGNVRYRKRTGIASYNQAGAPIYAGESWTITYYDTKLPQPFAAERILSIEEDGEEEVFDLTIDHPQHNFVADGVVVHNCFEEVLVTENGVVGLNNLAAPTMRRVEKLNGSLIGYVQDVTGRFTANQDELRRMLAGSLTIPKHVALFEDWQVCQFRMRSTTRRSPYGVCIPADGVVETAEGPKPIINVKIGERVYCRHAGMLRTTKVIDHVSNGIRPVFRLKTTHREIRATANHPFLSKVGGINRWKPLEELRVGDEIVAATALPGLGSKPALGRRLRSFDNETSVRLTEAAITAIRSANSRGKYGPRDVGLRKVFADHGLTRKQMSNILEGDSSLPLSTYKAILGDLGLIVAVGDFQTYHGPGAAIPMLPDFVDERFCRFWGFMLGDGWLTDEQVYFARGTDEDVNEFYEDYLRSFGLEPSRTNDSTQCFVNSTVLVKLMRELGWINGCKEKRIPTWVFAQDESLRRALIQGLVDSDGWSSRQTGPERHHIELANRDLVRDIKTLVDGLGWTCGNIRERAPREGMIRKGLVHHHNGKVQEEDQIIKGGPTYTITWHETPLGEDNFALEKIESIEFDCDEEVFDIGVADTDHNFLCDGLVVHNSVAEGARWIWKRLVMLEDAVMIYKLCLRGNSQIWTPEGRRAIKDLREGDEVYSYTTEDKLKKTKVVYKKHNGQDKIFRVFSDHREIFANKTHPVLVETIIPQGKGKARIRRLDYVEVQNLKPGVHRLVTPKKNAEDWEEIKLKKPALHSKARLTSSDQVERTLSYPKIAKEIGVHHSRAREFFDGNYELKTETAVALLDANGYGPEHLEVEEHWSGSRGTSVKGVTVPETVDEDFARWWGFLLGDGFITTRHQKKGHVSQNEVGFALGDKQHINERYKALFERYVPEVKLVNDQGYRLGAYSFTSAKFAEFMTMNGFIPGAHEKRLPEWIFRAHPEIKLAMIRGLADADAHIKPRKVSAVRGRVRHEVARFELCNKAILEDVRELSMQLGLTVTFIHERFRKGGRVIKGTKKPLPDRTSYCMDVSFKPQKMTEVLRGVEEINTDDIWDIGVEADEHNFVADGCVVHNTRSPARYAFYVDVTDVPPARVESFLKRAKRDLKKKKMANPNSNFLDMRYNPLCLSGETKIPLLNGSEKSLLEMVDAHERGEEQWVYSVDVNDGNKLVPGKVVWAGGTRKNAQLLKITLDNGESIKVTPDHKMIRRSGEFAEAQTLKVGDSLMPFIRHTAPIRTNGPLGYEKVYDPSTKDYVYTHQMVAKGLGIKTKTSGYVIHHEDCNKLNNDPRNLTEMEWSAHKALHHKLSRKAAEKLTVYNKTDKARAETAAANRKYDKPAIMREAITPEIREKQKTAAANSKKEFWADPKKKAQASKKMRYVYPDVFIEAIRQIIDEEGPKVSAPTIARVANERNLIELIVEANPEKAGKLKKVHRDMIRWMCHSLGFKNLKEFKAAEPIPHNHKVVKIEWLEEREDTYTLTVDTAHTFAVSAGVFVKNSNDEDFFIAVRDGRALSRVEVLSGPDYQNTDDVEYMQRKLHGALMVPRAYMGQDAPIQGRAILCLTGDTKVPLLDGRTRSLKELSEEYGPGDQFYVYSIGANGKITAGKAHSPQITRPNAEIWKVTLDNGETVRGTPDHPFMMRDGSYRRLDELKPNDSLMPLYRRDSEKSRDGMGGYDMHLCPTTGKWRFTHRSVASWKWNRILKREGRVIHHEDFDKRNNDPRNLSDPLAEDHLQIHRDHADKTILRPEVRARAILNSRWWTQSEENKELCRSNLERARQPGGGQYKWCRSAEHRQISSEQMIKQWDAPNSKLRARTQTDAFRKAASDKMKESIRLGKLKVSGEHNTKFRKDASFNHLVDVAKSYRCASFKDLTQWTGYSSCLIYRLLEGEKTTFKEFAERYLAYGYDPGGHKKRRALKMTRTHQNSLVASGKPGNHKVVSVEKLDVREDCYDFVVDGTHNYALDAGIFVHNSNEDVRAARVSLQVQKEIRNGIERLIRTDLAARRHPSPWGVDLDVMMTVPSNIYELAAMEVKNARADFAARIQPYTSMRWLLENVFHLSDEEIRVIEEQRQREAETANTMGMDPSFGAFTGGRPPEDLGPDPGAEGQGIEEVPSGAGGLEEVPGAGLEEVPGAGLEEVRPRTTASRNEWRAYDRRRRLEERRYRESRQNHEKLIDMIGSLQENDSSFARRLDETTTFLKEFKDATLKRSNGRLAATPSAGRGRPSARNEGHRSQKL